MEETRTFSSLIDDVVARSGRSDRLPSIISYARTTLRECSILDFFDQSLVELFITPNANPYIWERPHDLRGVLAIGTSMWDSHGNPIYAKERKPGVVIPNGNPYFYLSGSSFAMIDFTAGTAIPVAYYRYEKPLRYIANVADRPAQFNLESEMWEYHEAYDASDALREEARNSVSNWLLFYWYELIAEGTLAKLYKLVNDETRMRMSYALYKSGQTNLLAGESSIFMGRHT